LNSSPSDIFSFNCIHHPQVGAARRADRKLSLVKQ
jgi:hypothetical protein